MEAENGKATVAQAEQPARVGKKRTCARHCKKFWWLYLIIFILIVVLVVCLVIFVGVKNIAQSKINEAQLDVQSIVVTNTEADKFLMKIDSTITTDGSQHATIDAFDGVMYLEDKPGHAPFATVHFPETDSSKFQVVNVTQETPVSDLQAFTDFNTWLLANDTLRVTVEGNTKIHVKGLSKAYDVTFKKTITMPGLQSFNGTTVTDTKISITPEDDGNNFRGTAHIPNRSIVTFEIGNATFHNYLEGQEIGTVYIDNILLKPGVNDFPMVANITQLPVLTAIRKQPYCSTGVLPFQLRGKDVVNNGQHLTYYSDALASTNQTVPIDIKTPLEAIPIPVSCSSS